MLVGLGGSATTDGGLAALRALYPLPAEGRRAGGGVRRPYALRRRRRGVRRPEGATPAQVELLRRRLDRLAQVYLDDYGVDVRDLEGAGAAGGLAGGLAWPGRPRWCRGSTLVADEVGLHEGVEGADLVITAEGFLDEQSFEGKVVGGVVSWRPRLDVPCVAIVGEVVEDLDPPGKGLEVVSLVEQFGRERAHTTRSRASRRSPGTCSPPRDVGPAMKRRGCRRDSGAFGRWFLGVGGGGGGAGGSECRQLRGR